MGEFDISVRTRYPVSANPYWRALAMQSSAELTALGQRRDGFFYFLLVMVIVQFAAIALVVYGAVIRTYFGY